MNYNKQIRNHTYKIYYCVVNRDIQPVYALVITYTKPKMCAYVCLLKIFNSL